MLKDIAMEIILMNDKEYDLDRVSRAYDLAILEHEGQLDKAGNIYINHPLRMAYSAANNDEVVSIVLLCILHDILEDTDVKIEEVAAILNNEELIALELLTHRHNEPYLDYIKNIKTNELSLAVKLYDLEDNLNYERLKLLKPNVADRLYKKYTEALEILNGK